MTTQLPRRRERRAPSPASSPSNRTASRKGAAPRATWITDPNALLSALASATEASLAVERPVRKAPEGRPSLLLATPVLAVPEPPPSTPVLREDERIGHRSESGVVVIIRRRRAA